LKYNIIFCFYASEFLHRIFCGLETEQTEHTRKFALLADQFHVLSATYKRSATHLGYNHFVTANVTTILFINFLNPHCLTPLLDYTLVYAKPLYFLSDGRHITVIHYGIR
jgi:hypothetical protein